MKKLLLTCVLSFFYVTSASADLGVNVGVSGQAGIFAPFCTNSKQSDTKFFRKMYETPLPGKQNTTLLPLRSSFAFSISKAPSFAVGDFDTTLNPLAIIRVQS